MGPSKTEPIAIDMSPPVRTLWGARSTINNSTGASAVAHLQTCFIQACSERCEPGPCSSINLARILGPVYISFVM